MVYPAPCENTGTSSSEDVGPNNVGLRAGLACADNDGRLVANAPLGRGGKGGTSVIGEWTGETGMDFARVGVAGLLPRFTVEAVFLRLSILAKVVVESVVMVSMDLRIFVMDLRLDNAPIVFDMIPGADCLDGNGPGDGALDADAFD